MRIVDSSGMVYSTLTPLPGSSQVCIFHDTFVHLNHRNQGLGSKAHQERLNTARKLGYNYAICTVDKNNLPQTEILNSFYWKELSNFLSTKTGHQIALFGKTL